MEIPDDSLLIVTGAAGLIGSHLVRHLNEAGRTRLLLVDDLKSGEKWQNLVGKKFDQLLSKHELFSWLEKEGEKVEGIFHLGACSNTVEPDASYLYENNTRYSIRLAEYALDRGCRFIYASSAATYGDGSFGFVDDEEKLDRLRPLNMYGYSKHLFDLWLQRQGVLKEVTGLKYFNVFGPNEAHKGRMASAIHHLVPQVQKDKRIKLFKSSQPSQFKDGEQMRDFVWVDDVAKMTLAFLNNKAGGIFNIATGKPTTWNTLAKAVFEALGLPAEIDYIEMPEDLVGKYQNYTCADMTKTKKVLGPQAETTSVPEAIKTYVQQFMLTGKRW